MPTRKKNDYTPHIDPAHAPHCMAPGCAEAGTYKAPKSRESLARDASADYSWFCLDHIREHNQEWDYFAGLDSTQIEAFMRDATHGHRPTWTREGHVRGYHAGRLQDALYAFMLNDKPAKPHQPHLPQALRKALALLELEYPYSQSTLKRRYRALVKQHHPDVNKGNAQSEERFKQITQAYQQLRDQLNNA